MKKIYRKPEHEWLDNDYEKKCKKWGLAWKDTHKKRKRFSWKKEGEDFRKKILSFVRKMTKNHCSFCDFYPMQSGAQDTIEHFIPKGGKYAQPEIAYKWSNLYLACRNCQSKGSQYSKLLLKPDAKDYSFKKYFDINPANGEIIPNIKNEKTIDYERAEITIKLFKFNKNGKPKERLKVLNNYQGLYNILKINKNKFEDNKNKYLNINEQSYRYFIEVLLKQ